MYTLKMQATQPNIIGVDHTTQMNKFKSFATTLADPNCKDDISKLKAAQEISQNFEVILNSPHYLSFLDHSIKLFLKFLEDGQPHFIAEYHIQQVRKLILEMLYRLPANEALRPHYLSILKLMFKLLKVDNEQNVLVCLKIIIELHKQYQPGYSSAGYSSEIKGFLKFVKSIYSNLPNHMDKIFEPRTPIQVRDLNDINIEELLEETFTMTIIQTDKKNNDGTLIAYYLIPKAVLSLKVLQELPIIVVLMYQLYKKDVFEDVSYFIPLIMTTITLQPTPQQLEAETFNKEVFVDFMGAQIKTLSFLAYIIKFFQMFVQEHSKNMVTGMLGLLTLCPMEVAHLRRELLIAARHILATNLRNEFVPHMEILFNEDVLLGRGWTTYESLRPLAYSILIDLVHHVRQDLPLSVLTRAVHLFSKNVHDDSLATTIQTMSCKLLINLVDCIKKQSDNANSNEGRKLLMRMLEVFVLKFKTIAKIHLPAMTRKYEQRQQLQPPHSQPIPPNILDIKMEIKTEEDVKPTASELFESALASQQFSLSKDDKCKLLPAMTRKYEHRQQLQPPPIPPNMLDIKMEIKTEKDVKPTASELFESALASQQFSPSKDEKCKLGFAQPTNYNVADYRSLVKTLVCGVKTITWGCLAVKCQIVPSNQLQPHETLIFVRLVKWALKALDINTLNTGAQPDIVFQRLNHQNLRSKEEKEVLENFSGVFSMMNSQTFHEIFSTTIEYLVERVYVNPTLQTVPNTLLASPTTSPIFATVLIEYLLERMEEMGSNVERSNLYLRLFKLVFGSVSLFPTENENMLRPHLHQIVNRSMELAMSASEPYNYFLLLRALFRSIGGGSHDLLYQEFLPLLPNLLEGLNRLQSGLHKQHMKDLFVELCLTVPVRLSSLLPYLPMLMDPLVSALNGSQVLISQGLRTLELCVDNLQHDFLHEHIQPVRAELMQALWRTLRNNDQVAHVAFKVLGKFGGGNRKMMIEPQRLTYNASDFDPPALVTQFQNHDEIIEFPVQKIIETALNAITHNNTDPYYRKQAWQVVNSYLAASRNLSDKKNTLLDLFLDPGFQDVNNISVEKASTYKSLYVQARETHKTALTAMFVGTAIKDLRESVLEQTLIPLVRHYTMLAVAQQAGSYAYGSRLNERVALDPLVLIDALTIIMGHEERELVKPGRLAMFLIVDTATTLLGSKELACRLPLIDYLSEKMCGLCYERAWYAKHGGCSAIRFMFENCAIKWVYEHMFIFLKALLFVMMDLTGEVSSGALDMAKDNLQKMLIILVAPPPFACDHATITAQNDARYKVTQELVRQITSPHPLLRHQSMFLLKFWAEKQNISVTAVMEPFKDILAEMVPPTRHILTHLPAIAQMGLMEGNTFCTTLNPRLFTYDMKIIEHAVFIKDLLALCHKDDAALHSHACYKSMTDFTQLRICALNLLSVCHYLEYVYEDKEEKKRKDIREHIFQVLYKSLEKPNAQLQESAFKSLKQFLQGYHVEKEVIHATVRPLLSTVKSVETLTLNNVKMLSYVTQLFPVVFNEMPCEQLMQILEQLLTNLVANKTIGISKKGDEEQKIITVICIFHQAPAVSSKFISQMCRLLFETEQKLLIDASSPFREAWVKFLLRYPAETMSMFLDDDYIKNKQISRHLEYLIKHKNGKLFRDHLQNHMVDRLITMALSNLEPSLSLSDDDRHELQYQSIRIVSLLIKYDNSWLSTQRQLVMTFKDIWCTDSYQERHRNVDKLEYTHWKEPKILVKILLHYFCHDTDNNIGLLFQLLRATCERFVPEFQFLRDFLEYTVAQNYTVDWKRSAFFKFVELFPSNEMSQELKSKVIQLILIPCFAVSFERGETNKLVGGDPSPNKDFDHNVVSVFINKLIEPEKPIPTADCGIRISLLQFSCLLVEQASMHIHDHDANNKTQGFKLRKLMTFAWPCLQVENSVDPATRYHGHLLLSHIINKFAIHRKIVLQVFHSLLKAHAVEARNVVRQALDILTPSMPTRMEEGSTLLTHWTRKIIVDEGHSMQQLFHILQLVVKHYEVYYPVRHNLIEHMVNSIQRLGFSPTATLEHRKLAVELAEVIIKWELNGRNDPNEMNANMKRPLFEETESSRKKIVLSSSSSGLYSVPVIKTEPSVEAPSDHSHIDTVMNFLLKLACQVNDPPNPQNQSNPPTSSPSELLSKRCVILIKTALKPEIWSQPIHPELQFFDNILQTVDTPGAIIANVCTALELLAYLLGVLYKDKIRSSFKQLQEGLAACIRSSNSKIIKLVHNLLTKLMSLFPVDEPNSNTPCKFVQLHDLYATVWKVVSEGLKNYEKDNPLGAIMLLKAACTNNHSYIDLLMVDFMQVLEHLTREHLQPPQKLQKNIALTSELLILGLDLVKTRVVVMDVDTRATFIETILVELIEKTQDVKIMKTISKILEEWVKAKHPPTIKQHPVLREKSILLVKMMQCIEKRFADDQDLYGQFLELVIYIYTDKYYKTTELISKLESAFLAGLRCTQPHIRAKFFKVYDKFMNKKLSDRLLYIAGAQNWEAIGAHYWIKQCIEVLLLTAKAGTPIQMSHESSILPHIVSSFNPEDKGRKGPTTDKSINPICKVEIKEEVMDIEPIEPMKRCDSIWKMIDKHCEFIDASSNITTEQFLNATSQLCHMDTDLAEQVWLALFPKVWAILSEDQRTMIEKDILPFVTLSNAQKHCHPSAMNTFVEGLCRCKPPFKMAPTLMKFLGKSHNLCHRMALGLEEMGLEANILTQSSPFNESNKKIELLDSLGELYSLLHEEDLWAGIWQKHSYFKETSVAITYEQHGFFEQAQTAYEAAMARHEQESLMGPVPAHAQREVSLWNERWIRCTKELNQWQTLMDIAKNDLLDLTLLLESSWRVNEPNWKIMETALYNPQLTFPREQYWKICLYEGFLSICHPEKPKNSELIERYVENASTLCLIEWRKLPHIVSHIHLPYLQAAQQIIELQEAYQIYKGLIPSHQNSLHDIKAIIRVWRYRVPVIADDLSHWHDIFTWRQHHYREIVNHFSSNNRDSTPNPNLILGVHALALSIIHFGKIARKQKLTSVCLEALHKISTPIVPVVDCFQNVLQQVKCYLQMASMNNKVELQNGLTIINHAEVKSFNKEMLAELYAFKGMILHLTDKSDEANKTFAAAQQMHDTSIKAWALYGEYLEQVFMSDTRQIHYGVNAMACFLHACRHQTESKARKYIAKVLWLLSYDNKNSSLKDTLDKYSVGVPPILWLPWTPQLLNLMVQYGDNNASLNLLCQVGRMFPQAVYFPLRTLYLTLRTAVATTNIEPKSEENQGDIASQESTNSSNTSTNPEVAFIKTTPAMIQCTRIMKMQKNIHTSVITCLEVIADQMDWFRENWYEEVLRQLRQCLTKCYAMAFENRESVSEAQVKPHLLNFVKKLTSTFGIGIENISSSISANVTFNSAASESLARRAEETYQDPVYHSMKAEFKKDFDFTQTHSLRLHTLIFKLKKWIKILDRQSRSLLQSFLLEEKCRFLSNFTLKTAEVELPGEFLLPKHNHYYVRITRFMSRVDIVQKHNAAARRLYIRGHNGKIYPYLVVNESGLANIKREERVLQLLRMFNLFLGKQKETSRRFLNYTVPRVVVVSQRIRLVEDNPASISLLDIFRKGCTKLDVNHDDPIKYYYERLAAIQSREVEASHQDYCDILNNVQTNMIPKTMLKEWALQTFPSATDYWQFRKMFTLQLALACFAEYVLHLTRLNPDMMYLHQDSGLMSVSYFKFDVDGTGKLVTTRPIPFRLTPNIVEYLTSVGIRGPLTASMIATARCFVYPNFKFQAILKPILHDEMILARLKKPDDASGSNQDKLADNEQIINLVNEAVASITKRLTSLAQFDGVESKVGTLVAAANSQDNLCEMDPTWHPWL